MNPFQHPACNDVLRRPANLSEEECGDLHIMRTEAGVASFWKPEPVELEALKAGAPVMLIFAAVTHPPVGVMVLKPAEDWVDPTKALIQSLNDRDAKITGLLQLAKDLVSHANKLDRDHPDSKRLTDRLLDLIPRKANPDTNTEG